MRSKRGGARPGAGRPPLDTVAMSRANVTLDIKTVEKAKKIGTGNLSEGIRLAVAKYKLATSPPE